MASVLFSHVSRIYPGSGHWALNDLTMQVDDGEFVCVVGPSGSGKTTLLRVLAGLEPCDSGSVFIGDTDVTHTAPQHRDVAFVFQSYALYPHLSVADNIGFPLLVAGLPKAQAQERVAEAASLLSLTKLLARKPAQLSGGERQRVAMARAIVRHPRVFAMDEPMSSIDAHLRHALREEISGLQASLGITCLYVTHDLGEASQLGHKIAVVMDGELQQFGTPTELRDNPANQRVAEFLAASA
jgi:multiple sugar transport system ATP-binding protein